MIVINSSAVIAILLEEPLAPALLARLAQDPDRTMSVATYLETGTVLAGRQRGDPQRAIDYLNAFIGQAGITLTPVDEVQARLGLQARVKYGRGMGHGGLLNFGDTFSYALACCLKAPLLFIGNDFTTTDVIAALPATSH